jgi:hypothetical protein
MPAPARTLSAPPWSLRQLTGRSLLPLAALLLIAGVAVYGPWVGLVLAWCWWRLVCRIA